MKITEALLAEHQVFHSLFDHIESVAPRVKTLAEIKSLASLMRTMLDAHSHTEDELFIAPLEHCFEQLGHCETFHQEHDEIEANLKLIESARRLAAARRILLATVLTSRKHFDKEERIVFPLAERVLKSKTLTALGQTWMDRRWAALRHR